MNNFDYLYPTVHDEEVYFLIETSYSDGTSFKKEYDYRFPKSAFLYFADECRWALGRKSTCTVRLSICIRSQLMPLYVLIEEKFPF